MTKEEYSDAIRPFDVDFLAWKKSGKPEKFGTLVYWLNDNGTAGVAVCKRKSRYANLDGLQTKQELGVALIIAEQLIHSAGKVIDRIGENQIKRTEPITVTRRSFDAPGQITESHRERLNDALGR